MPSSILQQFDNIDIKNQNDFSQDVGTVSIIANSLKFLSKKRAMYHGFLIDKFKLLKFKKLDKFSSFILQLILVLV